MSAYLEGLSGEYDGRRVPIIRHHVSIGRGQGRQIFLHSTHISRNHAVVYYTNGVYSIRDERSRVGTKVNGTRVRQSQLRDGDIIDVGGNTFRFHLDGPRQPAPQGSMTVGNEMDRAAARAVARTKSYVGDAFLILALYYIGLWIGGLIFNIIRLAEVNRIKRESGIDPEGSGCLWALLVWHIIMPIIVLLGVLVTGGALLNWIGLDMLLNW